MKVINRVTAVYILILLGVIYYCNTQSYFTLTERLQQAEAKLALEQVKQQYLEAELEEVRAVFSEELIKKAYRASYYIPSIPLAEELQEHAYRMSLTYGVDYLLILAVMDVESDYNPNAVGKNHNGTKDYGLMQINSINFPELERELGLTDFLDPYQNIEAGAYILSNLVRKYEDNHKILMAYNMGETGMRKAVKGGYSSTDYSRKVLQAKEELESGSK